MLEQDYLSPILYSIMPIPLGAYQGKDPPFEVGTIIKRKLLLNEEPTAVEMEVIQVHDNHHFFAIDLHSEYAYQVTPLKERRS
jgi:hypothetical protein